MNDDWLEYGQQSLRDNFTTAVESLEYERHEAEMYSRLIRKHIDAFREALACHEPVPNLFELEAVMAWAERRTTQAAETLRDVDRVIDSLRRKT